MAWSPVSSFRFELQMEVFLDSAEVLEEDVEVAEG